MTEFENAYNTVIKGSEGGYVNDPIDCGGETYKGIARNSNPRWIGWAVVDAYKMKKDFTPEMLYQDERLQVLVVEFYKEKYWDLFGGDNLNPKVATELFDQAVNFGVSVAIEHLQRTINILNRNAKLYPDIAVDGGYGGGTFEGYKNMMAYNKCGLVVNILNGFQIKKYIEIMEKNHVQEKYIGWFGRVEINKNYN